MKTIRDYTFEEFCEATAHVGTRHCKASSWFGTFIDGVKCEIKRKHMTFGYGLPSTEIDKIILAAEDSPYRVSNNAHGLANFHYSDDENVDDIEYFLEIAAWISTLDPIIKAESRAVKLFDKKYSPRMIAKRYFFAIENEDQQLLDQARGLLGADEFDADIALNDPLETDSYREHVVPCIFIHNTVIQMILDGKSLIEVAHFIKSHLFIVHITKQQREYIDFELGLQTSMPDNWQVGDDVFARLRAAGIM